MVRSRGKYMPSMDTRDPFGLGRKFELCKA